MFAVGGGLEFLPFILSAWGLLVIALQLFGLVLATFERAMIEPVHWLIAIVLMATSLVNLAFCTKTPVH